MYIYEFIVEQKIILIETSNFDIAKEVIGKFFYKDLISLKSIYLNKNHYSQMNSTFPKYFKENKTLHDNKWVYTYEFMWKILNFWLNKK